MRTYGTGILGKLHLFVQQARDFLFAYRKEVEGMFGLVVLSIFIFVAVFAPWVAPHDPTQMVASPWEPPSSSYILGTEELGRDILSRIIYGARVSLTIGFVAALATVFIGTVIGLLSGYFGGATDQLLMRVTDLFLMMPGIPFMIVLAVILGPNMINIIIAITMTGWPRTARVVRSSTLTLKTRDFVEVAKSVGAGPLHIIYRHILPNVLPLIFATATLQIASSILSEAGLAFIGLADPNMISWGLLLHNAHSQGALATGAWWYVFPPGICILLIMISFVFISRSVDKILNPRLKTR